MKPYREPSEIAETIPKPPVEIKAPWWSKSVAMFIAGVMGTGESIDHSFSSNHLALHIAAAVLTSTLAIAGVLSFIRAFPDTKSEKK